MSKIKVVKNTRVLRSLADLASTSVPVVPVVIADPLADVVAEVLSGEIEEVSSVTVVGDLHAHLSFVQETLGGTVEHPKVISDGTDDEAAKPVREKPSGGYRIGGKFVSRELWEAEMDRIEDEFDARQEEMYETRAILGAINIAADDDFDGNDFDDGGPYNEPHSEDEAADMAVALIDTQEAIVNIADLEVGSHDALAARQSLLDELEQYFTVCGYSKDMLNRAKLMPLAQLREAVTTARINSGGSRSVAELLAATEEEYLAFVSSPDVQRKTALIEAKGSDFINMAQKLQRVMGTDVTINGVRFHEYHELLKLVVTHASVVDRSITSLADILRIEIPERLLLGGERLPVIEGMQINTRVAIYILNLVENNLRAWASSAEESEKLAKAYKADVETYRKLSETREKAAKEAQSLLNESRARHEKAASKVLCYVIVDEEGEYLCLDEDDKKLTLSNLAFSEDFDLALQMQTRSKAQDLADRAADYYNCTLTVTPIVALAAY